MKDGSNILDEIKSKLPTQPIQNNESCEENRNDDYERSPKEQRLLEEIANLKSDREMRKEYAQKAYEFAKYTIAFWAFLFFVYFLSPPNGKPLNDTALGIFTTACTINILAAFISIIKGLFPSKKDN